MSNIIQRMILSKGPFIGITVVVFFVYLILNLFYDNKLSNTIVSNGVNCSFKELHMSDSGFILAQCGEREVKINNNDAIEFMVNKKGNLSCAIKKNGSAECVLPKE